MKRLACILLIATILVSGPFLFQTTQAQIYSNLTIGSNTEWTVAQSPINFTGTVTVSNNVTLTIDPGVTVNMGYYGFDIYGTLIAQGTPGNQIVFTSVGNQTSQSGSATPIYLGQYNYGGSSSSGPASIFQYATFNGVIISQIGGSSPEIDSCVFNLGAAYQTVIAVNSGSPQISNNVINFNSQGGNGAINGIGVFAGTPQITNNQFEGTLPNPNYAGTPNACIQVSGGSAVITGNTFAAQFVNNSDGVEVSSGTAQISNNQFQGNGWLIGVDDLSSSCFTVSNNVFSGCYMGVIAKTGSTLTVQNNQFVKGTDGVDASGTAQITVTGNLIDSNSRYGINGGGTISSNTITNNQIGIHNPISGVISDNNIVCNSENSITATNVDIDARNNWWGIADTATINRTIYDSKVDPNLGTILFAPFLTQPSASAPAIPNDTPAVTPVPVIPTSAPIVTQAPIITPTPTPDQYSDTFEYQVGNIINLNLIATITAIAFVLVWVVVILGYAVKKAVSKFKAKK